MTEKQLTKATIELAQRLGWLTAHFRTAQTARGSFMTPVQGDGKGFPDLILVRGWRKIAVELKIGYRKPSPEQWKWLNALGEAEFEVYIWTEKDYPEKMKEVLR